jgi:hypothetical protein
MKSKFNYITGVCVFEKQSWCNLPKYKRCEDCIRLKDKTKACGVKV